MDWLMKSVHYAIIATIIIVWINGFACFIYDAISFNRKEFQTKCRHVAVLTGGRNRISHTMESIKLIEPQSIFISGVNKNITLKDILTGRDDMEGVDFILGKEAKNTYGNAKEINKWAKKNDIKEILLITSDYHMRRSLFELRNANKKLKIIPHAVESDLDFYFMIQCIKEFHRFVYIWCVKLLGMKR
jgi:uncharacterized SAM-binding protein YcdF (DUF218 family)